MSETPPRAATVGPADEDAPQWAADLLYGTEPDLSPHTDRVEAVPDADGVGDDHAHADDDACDPGLAEEGRDGRDNASATNDSVPDTRARRAAVLLAGGLAVAVSAIVAALVMTGEHPAPAAHDADPVAATPSPAPNPAPVQADQDQAIPFTASANCPAGSSSAQSVTETTTDSAWVCVRGASGARVDGQVLHVDFGRTYQVTAVSITPGWVAKTPGGTDEWLQHRVVSRVQYVFNDDDHSILTQDTSNAHGPVLMALPHRVLASRVTMIVLQTARPPASTLPPDPAAAPQPGVVDSLLGLGGPPLPPDATTTSGAGPNGGADLGADPVDATFAVSELKFLGSQPK